MTIVGWNERSTQLPLVVFRRSFSMTIVGWNERSTQLPLVVFGRSFSMTIVGWNERSTQLPLVVFCASLLKCEHELRLPANSGRREVAERHEEAWILSASPQRGLDVDQILESNLPRQTVFKTEVMRTDVDAGVCSEVVVGQLRDERVGAFDREDVEKRHVAAFCDPAYLQRRQHCVAFVQTGCDVARELQVELQRVIVIAVFPACVVESISESRDLETGCCVDRAARSGGCVAGT